jgi:MFS family permease
MGPSSSSSRGGSVSVLDELTPAERSFVLRQRCVEVLERLTLCIIMPHWNASYMELCGGDTGVMAWHYGKCALYVSALEMFFSPLVASLSDLLGRRHLMTWGRIGPIIFFSGHTIRDRSLRHRALFEAIPWGILQAGTWPVFAAAHSDMFGERPELSGRIKSADGQWVDLAGMVGPLIGIGLSRVLGLAATEHVSSLLTLLSMAINLSNRETLKASEKKPFRIANANPFSNIGLLLRNGPGLRRLTLSTSLWFWCQEIWSTQSAFRMGVLRWTPVDQVSKVVSSSTTQMPRPTDKNAPRHLSIRATSMSSTTPRAPSLAGPSSTHSCGDWCAALSPALAGCVAPPPPAPLPTVVPTAISSRSAFLHLSSCHEIETH